MNGSLVFDGSRTRDVNQARDFSAQSDTTGGENGETGRNLTSSGGAGLSPIVLNFTVVGVLFVGVVILALINLWIHFKTQERRRRPSTFNPDARVKYRYQTVKSSTRRTETRAKMTIKMKPRTHWKF